MENISVPRGLASGPFGSAISKRYFVDEGVPVIRGSNLSTDGWFHDDGFVFITDERADELANAEVLAGDLVFTAAGTLGQVGLLPQSVRFPRYIASNKQLRARIDPRLADNRFVFYWFSIPAVADFVSSMNRGSSVPLLTLGVLRDLPVPVPPLGEQRRIAEFIESIDRLIYINGRRIEILEDMARLIYREWFVHFRFPGHEDVELEASDLGPIPQGWQRVPVGSVLEFHIGGGWGQEYPTEEETAPAAVIRGTDIPGARSVVLDSVPMRYHKPRTMQKRLLQPGDVVLEVSGGSKEQPVGRSLLVTDRVLSALGGHAICASFCKLIRFSDQLAPEIGYLSLRELYASGLIDRYQVQSTGISNLKFKPFLAHFEFPVPPAQVQRSFRRQVTPLIDLSQSLGEQNRVLRQARDLILPRMISGELDVSDLSLDLEPVE